MGGCSCSLSYNGDVLAERCATLLRTSLRGNSRNWPRLVADYVGLRRNVEQSTPTMMKRYQFLAVAALTGGALAPIACSPPFHSCTETRTCPPAAGSSGLADSEAGSTNTGTAGDAGSAADEDMGGHGGGSSSPALREMNHIRKVVTEVLPLSAAPR